MTLDISIGEASVLIWLDKLLLAVGDTRAEAVREAVERLEGFVEALQQPSPAELAKMSEGKP